MQFSRTTLNFLSICYGLVNNTLYSLLTQDIKYMVLVDTYPSKLQRKFNPKLKVPRELVVWV